MTKEQVKQKACEYIDTQLEKNPDWLDCISDSWIYDAEGWFETSLIRDGFKIYTNDEDYEYTPEGQELHDMFWEESFKYLEKKDIEINGVRDGVAYLKGCLYDIKRLEEKVKKTNERLMPHFVGDCSLENPPKVCKPYFTILQSDIDKLKQDIAVLQKQIAEAIEKENIDKKIEDIVKTR